MKAVAEVKKADVVYKGKRRRFKNWQLYLMYAIPMFFVVLFCYVPMFGIIIAFKDYRYNKGILGSEWVGARNFEFLVKSNDFIRITWNTLSLNFLFIVVGIVAAIAVAALLFAIRSKGAVKAYQTILITPHFLSWVIVSYMVYAFLSPTSGLLNLLLTKLGMESVKWYNDPGPWTLILTICTIWKCVGMDCIIYYAALMSIDMTLFEAAKIDGANKWDLFRNVMLPCLIPLITVIAILKIGGIFRADFGLFYQVTRDSGALYVRTDVIDTYIYRTMRVVGDLGMSSAAGLLQSVVGFVLVIITNKAAKMVDSDRGLF